MKSPKERAVDTHMWLSFVDETGSLGVAIIDEAEIVPAVLKAYALSCNPGGEVAGWSFDMSKAPTAIQSAPVGKLMTPDEARALVARAENNLS